MDKLLNSINTRIKYISSKGKTQFVQHQCIVLKEKVDIIKRDKPEKEILNRMCLVMIRDVERMTRVPDQTKLVYTKMQELIGFLNELKDL